jgi:hypothetical protein
VFNVAPAAEVVWTSTKLGLTKLVDKQVADQ